MKISEVRPLLLSQVYTDEEVWGWSGGEVRVWHSTLVQVFTDQGVYTIPPSSAQALTEWLMLDPVNEWFGERVVALESEPLGGWKRTSELYRDFKGWAADRGHSDKFLPNLNTFGQRLKAMPGVAPRRRAAGTAVVGVGLREARSTSTLDDHW